MSILKRRETALSLAAAAGGIGLVRQMISWRRQAQLKGQVVLITGGSRGLGLQLAHAFGSLGCRIAICGRDTETLARAQELLAAENIEVFAQPCDITQPSAVVQLVAQVTQHYGQIDILVNNAVSSITVGPIEATTLADFEAAHAVLFWGVVYPTLAVLPQMRQRRSGRIVTIASVGGKVSVPRMLPYSCAKFAATAFTEGLRAELVGTGIKATTIAPGAISTRAHLHAEYVGEPTAEFARFTYSELLPGVSMSPQRVARQIVRATANGTSERIISLPALFLARCAGLFPGTLADILGALNRPGPRPDTSEATRAEGIEIEGAVKDPLLQRLMKWHRPALRQLNQYPEMQPNKG